MNSQSRHMLLFAWSMNKKKPFTGLLEGEDVDIAQVPRAS